MSDFFSSETNTALTNTSTKNHNHDFLMQESTVKELTQLSRVTIWRFHKSNRFPAPIKLPGSNRNRWKSSEVFAWIQGEWHPA